MACEASLMDVATSLSLIRSGRLSININRNTSLTKGRAKDIISPLGCNNHVEGRVYACGTYSGADLYYGLSQVMAVRGGLGVLTGGCLGAVCLACGMAGVVRQFEDSCSRIFFCLFARMPSSLVCASRQSLLRRAFAREVV